MSSSAVYAKASVADSTSTLIRNFITKQHNLTALKTCEWIHKEGLLQKLNYCVQNPHEFCPAIQEKLWIIHLRLAEYYHFVDSVYDLKTFGEHLDKVSQLITKSDLVFSDPNLAVHFFLEKSMFLYRKALGSDENKSELINQARDLAIEATKHPTQKEESFRAHTYSANLCSLLKEGFLANAHFTIAESIVNQIDNNTYKFGYYLYLGRFYKEQNQIEKAKKTFDLAKELIPLATTIFNKTNMTELINKEISDLS